MANEIAPRIVVDQEIRLGKPVVAGTRAPVALVRAKLARGMTPEEIAHEYEITLEDIRACLDNAADVVGGE